MMVPSALPGPILIIEDDKKTASLVALYLERFTLSLKSPPAKARERIFGIQRRG
jgi:hypothetical protein